MKTNSHKNIVLLSLFITLTFFLIGPLNIYFTNLQEFPFLLRHFLPSLMIVFIFFFLLFWGVFSLLSLKKNWASHLIIFTLAIGVLLWIQGNFLVFDYGALDGSEIEWSKYRYRYFLDTPIWILLPILFSWKRKKILPHLPTIVYAIIGIQIFYLTMLYIKSPPAPTSNSYAIGEDQKFDFSSQKNIFLIVLDGFQSDLFQEIINEDPQYAWNDFTFFRNTSSTYPSTVAAVPYMMTGEEYQNNLFFNQYKEKSFLSHSLPKMLFDHHYDVRLFPSATSILTLSPSIMHNLTSRTLVSATEIGPIYDITLFRYLPSLIKPHIHRQNKWVLRRNIVWAVRDFQEMGLARSFTAMGAKHFSKKAVLFDQDVQLIDRFLDHAQISPAPKPVFRYFHLNGIHRPLSLNENIEYANNEYNRENCKKQGIAMLKLMQIFLQRLKELKVYDNSLIFILGDHGQRDGIPVNPQLKDPKIKKSSANPAIEIIASASPLLLVKRINEKGKFKINDAPASVGDLPITISKLEKIDTAFPGKNIFELKENQKRTRRFLLYKRSAFMWESQSRCLHPMTEFELNGFVWFEKDWRKTGRIFSCQ